MSKPGAYVVPIHRPSGVRDAIKLSLLRPDQDCLVLAKGNRLEIWSLAEETEQLAMLYSTSIYGTITMLDKIRPIGSNIDHLFVGTRHAQFFTLAWNVETRTLNTEQSFTDTSEQHLKDHQSRDRCLVDPTGRYLVLELFPGTLSLVKNVKRRNDARRNLGYLERPEQVRITELNVLSMTFLYPDTKQPKLALLYTDYKENQRLAIYRIVDDKGQWSQFDAQRDRETDLALSALGGATLLIPVPKGEEDGKRYIVRNQTGAKAQLGGVLIVGEVTIVYLDDESKATVMFQLREATMFCAWERIDDLHFLLADDYGVLHVLELLIDGAVVTGMRTTQIGRASKAEKILQLSDDVYYIASRQGDSQLIRLSPNVELIQTFPNIGPILDFAVMDMGGREGETQINEYSSGQARLVTGSGSWDTGSMRSVRSGVGLDDVGIVDENAIGVRGLFTMSSGSAQSSKDTILASFETSSRLFVFGDEIEEVTEFRALDLQSETLLVRNLSNGLLLQVTTKAVTLHDATKAVWGWGPKEDGQVITAVDANDRYVLLASGGVHLVSIDVTNRKEVALHSLGERDQISCIHVPQTLEDVGVIGFWKTKAVSIVNLKSLDTIVSEELKRGETASVPRSIALTQLLPEEFFGPTLFVALEDGTVLSFNVDGSKFTLSNRKSIVLGTQQARLQILPREDGLFNVLATCEHPSLIYGDQGSVVYSAVTANDTIFAAAFNNAEFPNHIVVATGDTIKLARIDRQKRTHVQGLPLNETVRRIAYSAKENVFGLGCVKRDLVRGEEEMKSYFRLVNEVNLLEIGKPYGLNGENGVELVECVIRARLPTQYGGEEDCERFLVGTSFLESEGSTDPRGRILVFGVDAQRSPFLVGQQALKGACRRLEILDGNIVAALNKTIVVFKYEEYGDVMGQLSKQATFRCATMPIDITVVGNVIGVADLCRSLCLIEYTPGKKGEPAELKEIGRHSAAVWSTALVHIEDEYYLEADHDGNLLVLRRNAEGVTDQDKKRLDPTSEFNLGENVNKMQAINVDTTPNATIVPKAFIATTEGSIYLFSTVLQDFDLLLNLQSKIAELIQTPGNLDWNSYRAFRSAERDPGEPFRFVDGELIERFLDVDEALQQEICTGLGPKVEDVRDMVERLRRLH